MKNKQPKKAALYCRLSVDDGRMGESVSIGSQKLLLEQYCKDHAIDNYEVYDDDGYSGTNFDRPAFQRMYEDIQNGLIDTVLVKDQSRFGRSYIEVGMYVEKFKELGVRFIAVSDNYDSMKNENDMMFPMRNVLNDYFAREASIKTKTAKKAKAKAGQYIGSKPPFGYKLDPNDRHHLVIDEPAAETVRRIFRMAAQGIGFNRTTKIFREEKVLTPIAYFNLHNPDYFKSDYWRKEFDWHVTSTRLLKKVFLLDKSRSEVNNSEVIINDTWKCSSFIKSMTDEQKAQKADEILAQLDLIQYADTHPMALSGGQKQRTAIASGIASSKPIIIFDESTSGLDLAHMKQAAGEILKLRDMGKTVFIVTHDLEFILSCCAHIVRLEKGEVAENYRLDKGTAAGLRRFFDN